MKQVFVGALALAMLSGTPALADDPKDPAMRTAAARERDRAQIRELNRAQLAYVRERDAGYAAGWAATRTGTGGDYAAQLHAHQRALDSYAAARADYDSRMARWREQAAACNAGAGEACR